MSKTRIITHNALRPKPHRRPHCGVSSVQELRSIELVLIRRLVEEYPLHSKTRGGIFAPCRVRSDILQYIEELPLCVPGGNVANSLHVGVGVEAA